MRTITITLLLFCSIMKAQSPSLVWSETFGAYQAKSVHKTNDGGLIIGGDALASHIHAVDYHGSFDGFVVKVNSLFEIVWSKCYGTSSTEKINEIKPTSDGGYIFVGNKSVPSLGREFWIVKIDSEGTVIWEKTYGVTSFDEANSVAETDDGHYIVTGLSGNVNNNSSINNFGYDDFLTLKIDSQGELVYMVNHGGPSNDRSYSVVVNSDGTAVVAGESQSDSGEVVSQNGTICASSFWITKLSTTGSIIWAKAFGSDVSGANFFNTAREIIKTTDGGYAIAGSSIGIIGQNGLTDFYLIKIDSEGNLQWRNTWGGSGHDTPYSIEQTTDGGYILAGETYSDDYDVSHNLGSSFNNGWVVKVNATGELEWQKTIGGTGIDRFYDIIQLNDNDYLAIGDSKSHDFDCIQNTGLSFWLAEISASTLDSDEFVERGFNIYQSNNGETLNLKFTDEIIFLTIYDSTGKCIMQKKDQNIQEVDISLLPSGIYIVSVSTNSDSMNRKFIKL